MGHMCKTAPASHKSVFHFLKIFTCKIHEAGG
jgi:hypothetical protein